MSSSPFFSANAPDQLRVCRVDELRPHPGMLRHGLLTAVHKISALADSSQVPFVDPLTVTHEGFILDGYARWTLAKKHGKRELVCLVRTLSQQEALVSLLRAQHRSTHLNAFTRILLGLELEEYFRGLARANQQVGGKEKLLSDLTEAQRVDVRTTIAQVAGVSAGNVAHAKFLLENAAPELLAALKDGKVRIGRARDWLRCSTTHGREELKGFRIRRAMEATSKALLAAHPPPGSGLSKLSGAGILGEFSPEEQQGLLKELLRAMTDDAIGEVLHEVCGGGRQ